MRLNTEDGATPNKASVPPGQWFFGQSRAVQLPRDNHYPTPLFLEATHRSTSLLSHGFPFSTALVAVVSPCGRSFILLPTPSARTCARFYPCAFLLILVPRRGKPSHRSEVLAHKQINCFICLCARTGGVMFREPRHPESKFQRPMNVAKQKTPQAQGPGTS